MWEGTLAWKSPKVDHQPNMIRLVFLSLLSMIQIYFDIINCFCFVFSTRTWNDKLRTLFWVILFNHHIPNISCLSGKIFSDFPSCFMFQMTVCVPFWYFLTTDQDGSLKAHHRSYGPVRLHDTVFIAYRVGVLLTRHRFALHCSCFILCR